MLPHLSSRLSFSPCTWRELLAALVAGRTLKWHSEKLHSQLNLQQVQTSSDGLPHWFLEEKEKKRISAFPVKYLNWNNLNNLFTTRRQREFAFKNWKSYLLHVGIGTQSLGQKFQPRSCSLVLSMSASSGLPSNACGHKSAVEQAVQQVGRWGGVAG